MQHSAKLTFLLRKSSDKFSTARINLPFSSFIIFTMIFHYALKIIRLLLTRIKKKKNKYTFGKHLPHSLGRFSIAIKRYDTPFNVTCVTRL